MKARIAAVLVAGLLPACSGLAMQTSPPAAPVSALAMRAAHAQWSRSLRQVALPGAGCFQASYPSMTWQRIACSTERLVPGFAPRIKPNGDYNASVKPHIIASATGSFPVVSGVTSVRSTNAGTATGLGSYSLQLNSQFFSTAACGSVAHCQGWVQFVYRNGRGRQRGNLEIWDWLVSSTAKPLSSCPPNFGWHGSSSSSGLVDCYQTSPVLHVPNQSIAKLADLSLTGLASSGGDDGIELAAGDTVYAMRKAQIDGIVDLSKYWNFAEFNVFGYSTAGSKPSSANFNARASVAVSLEVDDGSTTAPKCIGGYSTTFEINNLTLGAPPANPPKLTNPSILFNESNPGNGASKCLALAASS